VPPDPTVIGYEFYDSLIPALDAGTYTVTTTHELTDIDTGDYFATPDVHTLEVTAPLFTLPAESVHAVYPPGGSVGRYNHTLVHIALDRAPLPWERRAVPADGSVPWVALLVFAAGELPGDPEAIGLVQSQRVGDLLSATDAIAPASPPSDATELLETSCTTVDVPAKLFLEIAPRQDELALLAHVRKGEGETSLNVRSARTRAQSRRGSVREPTLRGLGSDDDPSIHPDLHAVIIGNRFPSPVGGQYVAHLVSLDGFGAYLGPNPPPPTDKPLRMVSLHAWSFRSLDDAGASFAEVVAKLAAPGAHSAATLTLRLPLKEATGDARDRLSQGYTPVAYGLGSGEHTYAWYRGPLTPVAAQPVPVPKSVATTPSADAWLVYLEQYGIFDVSYAAAWTIGRSLALADAAFSAALMKWRQAARQAAGRLLRGHGRVGSAVTGARLAYDGLEPVALLDERPALTRFEHLLARGIADQDRMKPRPRRQPPTVKVKPAAALRTHLADGAVRAALKAALAESTDPVLDWLDRLALLYPLPFDHVIPHADLLPNESLRFCYLDRGWQQALLYGALSIGVATSLDADLTALLHEALDLTSAPVTGFVVRSAVVAEWPSLRVHVYGTKPSGGTGELDFIRADILGADVAMILVAGILDKVVLAEPPQALHFGFDRLEDGTRSTTGITLRDLSPKDAGRELPGTRLVDFEATFFRHRGTAEAALRVLEVASLRDAIAKTLGQAVTPAGLAIELVRSAQQITFAHARRS
jgi:hypothetical protein